MTKLAKIFSGLFHPIFILPYLMFIVYGFCGHLFLSFQPMDFAKWVINSVSSGLILPIIGILIMKNIGLIQSWEMHDKHERIGPLILTGLLYLWLFVNYYQSSGVVPDPITMVTLGASVSLFIAFFFNNFFKLSLHAVGVGGLIMGSILVIMNWSYGYLETEWVGQVHFILLLIIILIISGIVLSSRLYLGAHTINQIYHGFLVGIFGQILALRIIV